MSRVLFFSSLPITFPFVLVLVQILTIGDVWPRAIAPGSGLKMWGLIASALTAACVWLVIARTARDKRLVHFAALFCVMTGLMGWPFWSAGLLPSVNGSALGPERTLSMRLDRLEATRQSRQKTLFYWAWLAPQEGDSGLKAGRYFIPEDVHSRWTASTPDNVQITYARGALGALVVTGIN